MTSEGWRRRPDLNRGWRFCRPLPYHLATAPIRSAWTGEDCTTHGSRRSAFALRATADSLRAKAGSPAVARSLATRAKAGAGNGIRTRDFDLGKVALYH